MRRCGCGTFRSVPKVSGVPGDACCASTSKLRAGARSALALTSLIQVVLWLIDWLESGGFGSLEELVDCNFAGLEAPRLQLALWLWWLS